MIWPHYQTRFEPKRWKYPSDISEGERKKMYERRINVVVLPLMLGLYRGALIGRAAADSATFR